MADRMETLKSLSDSLHEQQKAIVVAGLGVFLFLAAPKSNEILREGAEELKRLEPTAAASTVTTKIDERRKQISVLSGSWSELKKSRTFTGDPGVAEPREEDWAALGVVAPRTLAELVSLIEGGTTRCEPHLDPALVMGLTALKGGRPFGVGDVRLLPVFEAEALAAVHPVFDAARSAAHKLKATPARGAPPAPSPVAAGATALSAPPQFRVFENKSGRFVREENPAYLEWQKRTRSAAELQESSRRQQQADAEAEDQLVEAATELDAAMQKLERAVDTQLGSPTGAPRFVVVRLGVVDGGRFVTNALYLPMACTQVPLLEREEGARIVEAANGALLPHLRASEEYVQLGAMPLAIVGQATEQALLKGEQTLSVFGLDVHERLVSRVAPWLLSALLFWYFLHLLRFRREIRMPGSCEGFSEAAVLPSVPVRQNWPLPLAIVVVIAVLGSLLIGRAGGDRVSIAGDVLAIVLSIASAGVVLATRIAPARATPAANRESR